MLSWGRMVIMMMMVARVPLFRGEGKGVEPRMFLVLLLWPVYLLSHTLCSSSFFSFFFFYLALFFHVEKHLDTICVCIDCPSLGVLHWWLSLSLASWNDVFFYFFLDKWWLQNSINSKYLNQNELRAREVKMRENVNYGRASVRLQRGGIRIIGRRLRMKWSEVAYAT